MTEARRTRPGLKKEAPGGVEPSTSWSLLREGARASKQRVDLH
jgi:hypothetical protein